MTVRVRNFCQYWQSPELPVDTLPTLKKAGVLSGGGEPFVVDRPIHRPLRCGVSALTRFAPRFISPTLERQFAAEKARAPGERRFVFAVIFMLMSLPTLARAQAGVTGVVLDPSGAVLDGVHVEAIETHGVASHRSVLTDASGRFAILGVGED